MFLSFSIKKLCSPKVLNNLTLPLIVGFGLVTFHSSANESQSISASDFQAEANNIANATYVFPPTELMAKKALISFHSQLLETNQDTGAMVMQLSADDKARLTQLGFRLAPASDWIANRRAQLNQLAKQFEKPLKNNSNDTINGYACYSTVEDTFARAQQLANDYPQYVNWVDIGDSWRKTQALSGYDIKVMQITNSATDEDYDEKPILFVHSAMHARELATAELTTRFAEYLLQNHDTDADIRWILDAHQVHIVFHLNPDGRKRAETGLFWRKNVNTNYCQSNSSSIGADLNRNFSFFWGGSAGGDLLEQCADVYRGPIPASEPETQALEQYVRSIFADSRGTGSNDAAPEDTHGMHIDVHSYGELILWPWGHTYNSAPNATALTTLGRKLAKFNGYSPMQSVGLYPTEGTSDDVSYGELGVAAITFEIGTSFFQSCSDFQQKVLPDNLDALMYAAKAVRAPYLLPSGPEVTSISAVGQLDNKVEQGHPIEVFAEINDGYFSVRGGLESVQDVKAARVFVNQLPWQDGASGIELSAVDGQIDDIVEQVQGSVATEDLAIGRNTLYVQGQDANGQWGVIKAVDFYVAEEGELPLNALPEAEFSIDCAGLNCSIDASASSDEDGTIVSYTWQLGDGSEQVTEAQPILTHRYLPGVYSVELMVTDNAGGEGSLIKELEVTNLLPTASFTYSCSDGTCSLDGSASTDSDGTIETYLWQVDGQALSANGATAELTYNQSRSYEVSLTVTDDVGDEHQTMQTVTVAVDANMSIPPTNDSSGGGGSMGWFGLLGFLGMIRIRRGTSK